MVVLNLSLLFVGCVGRSPVPTLEEQTVIIDDSLLHSIGVLPLHTYYKYELSKWIAFVLIVSIIGEYHFKYY